MKKIIDFIVPIPTRKMCAAMNITAEQFRELYIFIKLANRRQWISEQPTQIIESGAEWVLCSTYGKNGGQKTVYLKKNLAGEYFLQELQNPLFEQVVRYSHDEAKTNAAWFIKEYAGRLRGDIYILNIVTGEEEKI